ncbi:hypothetical protein ECDEC10F_2467 [Escherichia coli DEC10F]|nr:hypothetical protein ECDEC10F_2467 [Escherichia coli DEC10F]
MKSDVYYGTVLKTCRDFVIILVNNFIDRVTVTGNFSVRLLQSHTPALSCEH